jgi:hypothetical protein
MKPTNESARSGCCNSEDCAFGTTSAVASERGAAECSADGVSQAVGPAPMPGCSQGRCDRNTAQQTLQEGDNVKWIDGKGAGLKFI